EERLVSSPRLRSAAVVLARDPSPQVRFQAAFSLGEGVPREGEPPAELAQALATILQQDAADPWAQTAVLSSAPRLAPGLLDVLPHAPGFTGDAAPARLQVLARLAALVGARATDADLARTLGLLTAPGKDSAWQVAVLEGLGQGLQQNG